MKIIKVEKCFERPLRLWPTRACPYCHIYETLDGQYEIDCTHEDMKVPELTGDGTIPTDCPLEDAND